MAQRVNTQTEQQASVDSKFAKRHYVPLVFGWGAGIAAFGAAFVAWKNAALRDLVRALRQDSQWRSLDRSPDELADALLSNIEEMKPFAARGKEKKLTELKEKLHDILTEDRWVRPYGSGHIAQNIHDPYDKFIAEEYRPALLKLEAMKQGMTLEGWEATCSRVRENMIHDRLDEKDFIPALEKELGIHIERQNITEYIYSIYKNIRGHEEIEKSETLRNARKSYRDIVDTIVEKLHNGLKVLDNKIEALGEVMTHTDMKQQVDILWEKENLFKDSLQQSLEARAEYHKVLDKEVLHRLQKQDMPLLYKNLSQRDQFKTVAFAAVVGVAVGAVVASVSNWLVSAKYAQEQKMALKITGIQGAIAAAPQSFQDRLRYNMDAQELTDQPASLTR